MRPGTIQVDGGTLETGWWGPGPADAPTIVLLHEGLGSVALWRDVPERLAKATGWGVFAYSRFGYGQSDPVKLPRPMSYMHDEARIVLPQVLQAAGIRRTVIVGHSDGGSIAAIYAGAVSPGRSRPIVSEGGPGALSPAMTDRVKPPETDRVTSSHQASDLTPHSPSATLTDMAAPVGNPQLLGIITIAAHFFVEDLNLESIRQIKVTYETGDLRPRLARYHRDVDVAFHGWNGAWLDPRFRDFDITGFLPHIAVPVLALQGADDPYGTDEQLRVFAAKTTAPIETHLIPGAKHSPHLEAKDATLATITAFIADLKTGFPT